MPNPENLVKYRMKKGQTLNPNGRPRKWVSQLKDSGYRLSEINDALQVLLQMTQDELKEVTQKKESTILETTVAGALLKGNTGKSLWSLETLLTRIYGKPKELTENTGTQKIVVEYVNPNNTAIPSSQESTENT